MNFVCRKQQSRIKLNNSKFLTCQKFFSFHIELLKKGAFYEKIRRIHILKYQVSHSIHHIEYTVNNWVLSIFGRLKGYGSYNRETGVCL